MHKAMSSGPQGLEIWWGRALAAFIAPAPPPPNLQTHKESQELDLAASELESFLTLCWVMYFYMCVGRALYVACYSFAGEEFT